MAHKKPRADFSPETQTEVLVECGRKCAFCFGLRGDARRKKGQLAHIDRDHSNNARANAAYLCLYHHDEYDSTPSQSKRLTSGELIEYTKALIAHVNGLIPSAGVKSGKPSNSQKAFDGVSIDVYKERLPIYAKTVDFLRAVAKDLHPDTNTCLQFARDTELALFLFDQTIADYLMLLFRNALQLHSLQYARGDQETPENFRKIVTEKMQLSVWFTEQYDVVRARFAPFLSLADQ